MKRAVLYLRVSTIEQTTANQERELQAIAERMGWESVKVYKDHGISGAKGRDKRRSSMPSAEMPPSGNSTLSWRGLWTGLAGACRILWASCPSCMHCASTYSCTSKAWTRLRPPERPYST
jgi:hypothetical protein